jgi:hypothetical protein
MLIPTGVGVAGARVVHAHVVSDRCRYPLRTADPTGTLELDGAGHRLDELFAIWGQRLDAGHLASFSGPVRVYVNGRRLALANPADTPLTDRAEVVVECGPFIPPHPRYVFAPPPVG